MYKTIRFKIFISLMIAFTVVYFPFKTVDSPQSMVMALDNAIYHNNLTNRLLTNNKLYDKIVTSLVTKKVEAAEKTVTYKGMVFKVYSINNQVPEYFLEQLYQERLKESGQMPQQNTGSHIEIK